MSHLEESIITQSEWLHFVKANVSNDNGVFRLDNSDVILEWSMAGILSAQLATFKTLTAELASQLLAPIETQFLRAHPEAASQELFLRSCAPLLEQGAEGVDWTQVENTIAGTIKQFYTMDLSKFGAEVIKPLLDDIYFMIAAKEESSGQLLGFLMASITPALPTGSLKVINLVAPIEHAYLNGALLSALFKIIPDLQRLFTFARPTNEADLRTLQFLGFSPDANPISDPVHKVNLSYLTQLEYKAADADILQKRALTLN
ncbi:MAG: hypothetical protein Q8K75_11635 [Chlamydiales bacterium]|nr:hypothetical protein [Chlamydiales bacterium]